MSLHNESLKLFKPLLPIIFAAFIAQAAQSFWMQQVFKAEVNRAITKMETQYELGKEDEAAHRADFEKTEARAISNTAHILVLESRD